MARREHPQSTDPLMQLKRYSNEPKSYAKPRSKWKPPEPDSDLDSPPPYSEEPYDAPLPQNVRYPPQNQMLLPQNNRYGPRQYPGVSHHHYDNRPPQQFSEPDGARPHHTTVAPQNQARLPQNSRYMPRPHPGATHNHNDYAPPRQFSEPAGVPQSTPRHPQNVTNQYNSGSYNYPKMGNVVRKNPRAPSNSATPKHSHSYPNLNNNRNTDNTKDFYNPKVPIQRARSRNMPDPEGVYEVC